MFASVANAQEKPAIPKTGQFPEANKGTYLAGEIVIIDPVNRRGGLRPDGDASKLHYFAMLSYGLASYNGAPAELRDLPIGTHVHGYFHLPPPGEEQTIPPERSVIPQNHALTLEDDFSFYQRRGQAWKVVSLDAEKGKIRLEPSGELTKEGINTPYIFDIDTSCRVWKNRQLVELAEIAPGTTVQFNLSWSQGFRDKEFTVSDIWLDDGSAKHATEMQRRRHVRYQMQRWLPGWIEHVEHNDYGGGIVTLTLFGGMDASLYADLKKTQEKGFHVAVAEQTLRTWFHRSDRKLGKVAQWKEIENPPPGSSGIQIKIKFTELLEGYRPGRCVRLKADNWPFVTMPPEERVKSVEEQKSSLVLGLPQ
ncbi:MAG: hypothetical protein ACKVP0_10665 [Pirellulaceae bacterium]